MAKLDMLGSKQKKSLQCRDFDLMLRRDVTLHIGGYMVIWLCLKMKVPMNHAKNFRFYWGNLSFGIKPPGILRSSRDACKKNLWLGGTTLHPVVNHAKENMVFELDTPSWGHLLPQASARGWEKMRNFILDHRGTASRMIKTNNLTMVVSRTTTDNYGYVVLIETDHVWS